MKHINKYKLFTLVIAAGISNTITNPITPYFSIRSQGVNAPRHAVGTTPTLYAPITLQPLDPLLSSNGQQCTIDHGAAGATATNTAVTNSTKHTTSKQVITDQDSLENSTVDNQTHTSHNQPSSDQYDATSPELVATTPGLLGATFEYTRSFDYDSINRTIFGNNLIHKNGIKISGSQVANRGPKDWLADYFYLPNDFESTVCFKPSIDNFIVDFNLYLNLDRWVPHSYFSIYAPLVHTRWNMHMHESVYNRGVNPQVAGLFTPQTLQRGSLLEDFTAFASGVELAPVTATPPSTPITSNFIPLTIFQQLKYAQISCQEKSTTRFADVRAYLGWNIIKNNYHVGFSAQVAVPTGSRPSALFLFEPIVGNGNHWEVGAGIDGHYDLWNNRYETASVTLYGEINITHLVHTRQLRTFDLRCKPFSRYMLAQKMGAPVENNLKGGGTSANAQFEQEFTPLANISTIPVNVSVGVQADMLIMVHADWHRWSCDIGYNLWGRSCENISRLNFNILDTNSAWALKGDAQMFGFATEASINGMNINNIAINQPIALSATQNNATIYSGLNGASPTTNPNIDAPKLATVQSGPTSMPDPGIVTLSSVTPATNPPLINTSIQPVFIKETDLDLCSAQTSGLSNAIFAHFNYQFHHTHGWTPHIGFGAQIEVNHAHGTCDTNTDGCQRSGISQWGIWIKTGFAFE